MMIGIGAGQQSRVDCVKLAGRKVNTWWARQHPKVLGLKFKEGVKRQERVNARVRYIEGDFTAEEKVRWNANFDSEPEAMTQAEKDEWLGKCDNVILSSDAFFPFRDGIDVASRYGVKYVGERASCSNTRRAPLGPFEHPLPSASEAVRTPVGATTRHFEFHAFDGTRRVASHCLCYTTFALKLTLVTTNRYISQPGGSVQDQNIIETCDSYNMSMAFTGVRLFHH